MFNKDTPHLNDQLIRWLIAYFISRGNGEIEKCYEEIINFAKIDLKGFRNIINEMVINGYITKNKKPIYALKPKCKNILEVTSYQHLYSLTQEGKEQVCSGWKIAGSAIPKELWNEALENICKTSASINPPFI